MELKNEEITFKTSAEYYDWEKSDIKNNTVRYIDWEDERFLLLKLMELKKEYGWIKINQSEIGLAGFIRKIKHICTYDNLMIITWIEHKKDKQ